MKMSKKAIIIAGLAVAILVCVLIFVLSRPSLSAALMRLELALGTVNLEDEDSGAITIEEGMRLFDGNILDTEQQSYAFVSLDETKAVKLDAISSCQLKQDGKLLKIELNEGKIFFNVTSPLADEEVFDIVTSTMISGIRGTSGVVSVIGETLSYVTLLTGSVEISAENGNQTAMLSAGQTAEIAVDPQSGAVKIEIVQATPEDIPGFVLSELKTDAELLQKQQQSDLDLTEALQNAEDILQRDEQEQAFIASADDQDRQNGNALFELGKRYYDGDGVEQSYDRAVKWFTLSSKLGNAAAQNDLGRCYYNGYGVAQDYGKAAEFFTFAARQGYSLAQNNLGVCYYYGNGVMQDYEKATEWYLLAAEQGNHLAQYNLGVNYYNGSGVPQDTEQAVKWLTLSADLGYQPAQDKLDEINP